MPRVRELRWLLAGQALVAFVALVVVVPRLVDCISVEVASSGERGKVDALQDIASDYNRADHRVGDRCVEVRVDDINSGVAMSGLRDGWSTSDDVDTPEPEVWMPASSMWLELLRASGAVPDLPDPGDVTSVASSNLVVAMPQPMAEALGWPRTRFSWQDLRDLADKGWPGGRAAKWGRFSFVKDDVDRSTTGLGATLAAYYAASDATATGERETDERETDERETHELNEADVDNAGVIDFVQAVEAGVHYYVDDTDGYLRNLASHDAADPDFNDPFVSAVVLEEQLLYDYNSGAYDPAGNEAPPHTKLVALYPTDGLLALDHPYVVLPTGSDAQQQAAADFLDHLRQPGSLHRLTDVGFRDPHGRLTVPDARTGFGLRTTVGQARQVVLPSGEVLQRMLDTYDEVRKPARILLLVDSSGVVGDALATAGDGRTRVEVVQEALDRGLGQLPGDAEIGLWAVPDSEASQASHEELVALGPLDADQRQRIVDGVADLSTTETGEHPPAPLYRAIRAAYDQFLHDRSINAVVVLTDGEDRDRSAKPVSLEQLVAYLDAEGARGRTAVRVFSIALPGASFPALDAISDSSNAEAFLADDPDGLAEAFDAVFSRL